MKPAVTNAAPARPPGLRESQLLQRSINAGIHHSGRAAATPRQKPRPEEPVSSPSVASGRLRPGLLPAVPNAATRRSTAAVPARARLGDEREPRRTFSRLLPASAPKCDLSGPSASSVLDVGVGVSAECRSWVGICDADAAKHLPLAAASVPLPRQSSVRGSPYVHPAPRRAGKRDLDLRFCRYPVR